MRTSYHIKITNQKARKKLFKLLIFILLITIVVFVVIVLMMQRMIEIKEIVSFRDIDAKKVMGQYKTYCLKNKKQEIINNNKAKEFVSDYASKSPLIEHIDVFFENDQQIGKIALAIAGNETLFATTPNHYNAWGYGCNSGYSGGRFDCGWRDWNYAIKRYEELTTNIYLKYFDGTKESVRKIANAGYYKVGMDKSTIEDQNRWVNNVYWFTQQL